MTSRNRRSNSTPIILGASMLLAIAFVEVGCKKEEAPPPPPRMTTTPQVAHQPAPDPWTIDDIQMHERVEFPAQFTPRSEEAARAIAAFASALVTGDGVTLQSMMDERGRRLLDAMIQSGDWDGVTASIQGVRIVALEDQGGGNVRVGIGVQGPDFAYLTGWQANGSDDAWTFSGINVGVVEAEQLPMLDGSALKP